MFTILKNILNEMLLNESASVGDVNSAIDNHERIIINYHTKGEDKNTGARVIEVYAYGLTKAGNPCIRAFQPFGDTTSKTPNWKFFRLDRISAWKPTGQKFNRPADFFYKGLGNFNPNGDETMSVVYKIADFNNNSRNKSNNGPLTNKQNNDVFKTDTEHRMERLRNQLNNPIKITDLMKNGKFVTFKDKNNGPKTKPAKKEPEVYKTDTERGMENLRKQLDNPKYIHDVNPKYNDDISNLRKNLGDTSSPISIKDLKDKLSPNNGPKTKPAKKEPEVYKTDTERGMENLRKQLDNPKYIDLSKIK